MENRMNLNKKPVYDLPDNVLVEYYKYSKTGKQSQEPDYEPDLCINVWGHILGQVIPKKSRSLELWIKTDNQDLINFIKEFNWYSVCPNYNIAPVLNIWKFKKIILEEFYNKKGEIKK